MPLPKGKKVKKNVEPELSVEDGETVQVEEIEIEPPTLEIEGPIQMGDELEEQAGESPIQMGDQTEKPEPEKTTGSVDMNAIMTMFQRMEETIIGSLREDNNKNKGKRYNPIVYYRNKLTQWKTSLILNGFEI